MKLSITQRIILAYIPTAHIQMGDKLKEKEVLLKGAGASQSLPRLQSQELYKTHEQHSSILPNPVW